ncbi:MAG: ATP-binding protein [Thermoleophilia bacterium]
MTETGEATASASLIVLCRPDYLALGRLVAGALGARQGWDEEVIVDLKVVVSEVASFFLASSESPAGHPNEHGLSAGCSLRLDFEVAPDEWTLTVTNPDLGLRIPRSAFSDPTTERALGLTVVQALADSVEHTDDEAQGTVFRLRKHISPIDIAAD